MRSIAAREMTTKLVELLEEAEKGESFEITKDGRPIARLIPADAPKRTERAAAAARLKARLAREPRVSPVESQANWERLKAEIEAEDDERVDRWLSSSTPP
jgi:prevent-host-death family protein